MALQVVDAEHMGSIVAVDMSVGSLSRAVTPVMGTWLMSSFGFRSIGGTSAMCLAIIVVLLELGVVQCAPSKDVRSHLR